ncbi:hypothetical protein BBJ28_00008126 [Nothophytophthora sp. Chile5]|nr:hypothetical protein BBJ28_00008126 [Nothophytophthora sp. Chile5]
MCLYCLAQYPDEQQKLLEELQGDRRHVYLEAVVKETLRLFPAQPFVRRRAKEDVVLSDGTFVASGTEVAMATYSTARREDVWGLEAAQFRPERWLNSQTGKLRPVSSYRFNAFLGGPHACLGVEMALSHVKTVLIGVLSQFCVGIVEMGGCEADFKSKGASSGHIPSSDGTIRATVRRRGPGPSGEFS